MTDTDALPLPVMVPEGPLSKSVRERIETHVAEVIPDGKRLAVLGVATQDGWAVTVATRIGNSWQLGADASSRWGGKVQGQVYVVGSW